MSAIRVSDEGDTILQKHQVILQRSMNFSEDGVIFSNESDEELVQLETYKMFDEMYDEMGKPSAITLTIEPGDTLNADL